MTALSTPPDPVRGFASVPDDIKSRPQWVCWKFKKRGNKVTKVPYQARNPFALAKPDDPDTWGTFDEALKQLQHRKRTGVDGIGYVFSADDPYVGVDLDNCIEDGKLLPWAQAILAQLMPSYAEVSPSGRGLKIWVKGSLPGAGARKTKFGPDETGAVEVYDRLRYFTVTGQYIKADYLTIEDRSEAILELYEAIKPTPKVKSGPRAAAPTTSLDMSDSELISRALRAKNGPKFSALYVSGDISGYGSESEADFALVQMIAFWSGPDDLRIERLFNGSALAQRGKWQERPDYRATTIENALRVATTFYQPPPKRESGRPQLRVHTEGDGDGSQPVGDSPVEVLVQTREVFTNDEACAALALDPEVYCRGGLLAEVIQEDEPKHKLIIRPPGTLRIATMSRPRIRDVLTRDAIFVKKQWNSETYDFDKIPTHPPDWCVSAVEARGRWPGVRSILGIVETPILRPDGSILTEPGYDPATFLFYRPGDDFPEIPESPTLEDARKAAQILLELVFDFPFVDKSHKASWLSAVLTVFARFAIYGPVPLHYFDANCRGTGKSLLTDLVAIIFTGRGMPRTAFTDDDNELRKRITSVALAGDILMLLDNVDVPFGSSSLDAMLTAMTWRDRILGVSSMTPELPLFTCWFGSGNNTIFKGDITRRMMLSRIQTDYENPETRGAFKIPGELTVYAKENRGKLVAAALTILKAHFIAERPQGGLVPMGSYESWSKIVRSAIFWATGDDPLRSTDYLRTTDPEAISRAALLNGWMELPGNANGVTAGEAIKELKDNPLMHDTLRAVLLEWSRNGDLPSPRSIGMKLNSMRGRVIGNKRFTSSDTTKGSLAWKVEELPAPPKIHQATESTGTTGTTGTNPSPSRANDLNSSLIACNQSEKSIQDNSHEPAGNSPCSPCSPASERERGHL